MPIVPGECWASRKQGFLYENLSRLLPALDRPSRLSWEHGKMQGHIWEMDKECVLTGDSHFGTDMADQHRGIDQRHVA